jgi:hypothetical protein
MFSTPQIFISKQIICLISTRMSYSNKGLFLARFVYLILSQEIFDLTSNIKNLTFFNKWQCYVVFKKRHSFAVNIVDCRRLPGRVAGHVPFATLGSHI